jgi:hypothetical protein
MLEEEVDEKYIISDKLKIYYDKKIKQGWRKELHLDKDIASTICNPARNNVNDTFVTYKEYTNFYVIPRGSDGKLINGSYNRVWKKEKQIGALNLTKIQEIAEKDKNNNLHIRKLTSRETWRLMGFSDDDYNKASKDVRLTAKQVFIHPWVKKYEMIKKQEQIAKAKVVKEAMEFPDKAMDEVLGRLEKLNAPKKQKKKRAASKQVKHNDTLVRSNKRNGSMLMMSYQQQDKHVKVNDIGNSSSSGNKMCQSQIDGYYDNELASKKTAATKKKYKNHSPPEYTSSDMMNSIRLLENAEKVKEETNMQYILNKQQQQKEESFWDKLFKPFKCGKD